MLEIVYCRASKETIFVCWKKLFVSAFGVITMLAFMQGKVFTGISFVVNIGAVVKEAEPS